MIENFNFRFLTDSLFGSVTIEWSRHSMKSLRNQKKFNRIALNASGLKSGPEREITSFQNKLFNGDKNKSWTKEAGRVHNL